MMYEVERMHHEDAYKFLEDYNAHPEKYPLLTRGALKIIADINRKLNEDDLDDDVVNAKHLDELIYEEGNK